MSKIAAENRRESSDNRLPLEESYRARGGEGEFTEDFSSHFLILRSLSSLPSLRAATAAVVVAATFFDNDSSSAEIPPLLTAIYLTYSFTRSFVPEERSVSPAYQLISTAE